jgi:ficolin
MEDNGEKVFAKYSTFSVGDSSTNYMLNLAGFSGNAGGFYNYVYSHALMYNCMLMDRRQLDEVLQWLPVRHGNCAVRFKGAWWYSICHEVNLNGLYHDGDHASFADGVNWKAWKGYYYSIQFTDIKVR